MFAINQNIRLVLPFLPLDVHVSHIYIENTYLYLLLFLIYDVSYSFIHCGSIKPQVSETVIQGCSVKKVFLKILQNSQENTCARVSFLIKLLASFFIENLWWLLLKFSRNSITTAFICAKHQIFWAAFCK